MSSVDALVEKALARSSAALGGSRTQTPHYGDPDTWTYLPVDAGSGWHGDTYDHGNWTAGFWVGIFSELEKLGARIDRGRIESLGACVASRATDDTTHDLGFLFAPSACELFATRSDERWRDIALTAASTLASRFRSPGKYIQAFGSLSDEKAFGTSTIDTMMNLPLLWWAHSNSGDSRYRQVALEHTRHTLDNVVRPDGSTYHLIRHDAAGRVSWCGTFQGAGDESCWARGQAWAVSGFIEAAVQTGDEAFASAASALLSYFVSNGGAAGLPPYDFRADTGHVDASASCIVAAGLAAALSDRQLSEALGAPELLVKLLEVIMSDALFAGSVGIVGRSVYSLPHKLGLDGPLPFGDYYFLRALRIAREHSLI